MLASSSQARGLLDAIAPLSDPDPSTSVILELFLGQTPGLSLEEDQLPYTVAAHFGEPDCDAYSTHYSLRAGLGRAGVEYTLAGMARRYTRVPATALGGATFIRHELLPGNDTLGAQFESLKAREIPTTITSRIAYVVHAGRKRSGNPATIERYKQVQEDGAYGMLETFAEFNAMEEMAASRFWTQKVAEAFRRHRAEKRALMTERESGLLTVSDTEAAQVIEFCREQAA